METITLYQLFKIMLENMTHPGPWPAETKIEIIAGAILVQNTTWKNAERSLDNLRQHTAFDPAKIASLPKAELQELIRPSGFYQNKSRALQEVFNWLEKYQYDFTDISDYFGVGLRTELLAQHGIGEETADVLLLYVFDHTVFVADSYARRLFTRLSASNTNFQHYRQLYKAVQPFDQFTLTEAQEFHALIDEFGKHYLRKFEDSFLAGYKLTL